MGRAQTVPPEVYGTEVPAALAKFLHRVRVTPSQLGGLIGVVGHHWPAIEAHVRSHVTARQYVSCTTLPGNLCDRWCPIGGDPDLIRAATTDGGQR